RDPTGSGVGLSVCAGRWTALHSAVDSRLGQEPSLPREGIMDTSTIISLTGGFLKFVGETLADVKRQDLTDVDAESLRLKRVVLAEKLEQFKANLDVAAKQEKAKAEQDLISRGL